MKTFLAGILFTVICGGFAYYIEYNSLSIREFGEGILEPFVAETVIPNWRWILAVAYIPIGIIFAKLSYMYDNAVGEKTCNYTEGCICALIALWPICLVFFIAIVAITHVIYPMLTFLKKWITR